LNSSRGEKHRVRQDHHRSAVQTRCYLHENALMRH
jgi:hypothetical protein